MIETPQYIIEEPEEEEEQGTETTQNIHILTENERLKNSIQILKQNKNSKRGRRKTSNSWKKKEKREKQKTPTAEQKSK